MGVELDFIFKIDFEKLYNCYPNLPRFSFYEQAVYNSIITLYLNDYRIMDYSDIQLVVTEIMLNPLILESETKSIAEVIDGFQRMIVDGREAVLTCIIHRITISEQIRQSVKACVSPLLLERAKRIDAVSMNYMFNENRNEEVGNKLPLDMYFKFKIKQCSGSGECLINLDLLYEKYLDNRFHKSSPKIQKEAQAIIRKRINSILDDYIEKGYISSYSYIKKDSEDKRRYSHLLILTN